jgi:hypothetical protein
MVNAAVTVLLTIYFLALQRVYWTSESKRILLLMSIVIDDYCDKIKTLLILYEFGR